METSRCSSYLWVVGLLVACVEAQTSLNQTETIVPMANASDVNTTAVPSSTASMDASSTMASSLTNSSTSMPASTNDTASSSTSSHSVPLVPQFVEQPPSFPPPPPPAQFNPATDELPDLINPNISTTTTTTTTTVSSSSTIMSVLLSSSSPSSASDNVTSEPSSTDGAPDDNMTTSDKWMPGNFPPPGMTSAADSGIGAETTTPSTTPLTVVEVGNGATPQNDDKQKYDVNNWNSMPNDAPADSPETTKENTMGSTVSYSKGDGPSAQQKTDKNSASTRDAHLPLLAATFALALFGSSRM